MALRYFTKFSNEGETEEFVFPKRHYDFTLTQPLRVANVSVIGKHYGVRLLGANTALKDFAKVTIRFLLMSDAERDEMETKLYSYGLGYLHTNDGLKALAELASMPDITVSYDSPSIQPTLLNFIIHEDFA